MNVKKTMYMNDDDYHTYFNIFCLDSCEIEIYNDIVRISRKQIFYVNTNIFKNSGFLLICLYFI